MSRSAKGRGRPRGIHFDAAAVNRKRLRKLLGDGVVALQGGAPLRRNGDSDYPFRQDSDFLFLTGWEAPNARLVMGPGGDTLFIPRTDQRYRVWVGEPETTASAKRKSGFARVRYVDEFDLAFSAEARGCRVCHTRPPLEGALRKSHRKMRWERSRLARGLKELRVIKSREEVELISRAASVTSAAHEALMAAVRPGMYEYQARAIFEKEIACAGLCPSYPSIVGSGANAAVIHYEAMDRKMEARDLLLVDAAAECHGYAADVTRTFPVGGRFTGFGRALYELAYETNLAAIGGIRPGVTARDVTGIVHERLCRGLLDLRILRGRPERIMELGTLSLFLPHGLMHHVGLDVHDAHPAPRRRRRGTRPPAPPPMREGMVLAVEAALYFVPALLRDPEIRRKHRETVNWPEALKHLDLGGIRVEDNVVVTDGGCRVLTTAPKASKEIESVMRRR